MAERPLVLPITAVSGYFLAPVIATASEIPILSSGVKTAGLIMTGTLITGTALSLATAPSTQARYDIAVGEVLTLGAFYAGGRAGYKQFAKTEIILQSKTHISPKATLESLRVSDKKPNFVKFQKGEIPENIAQEGAAFEYAGKPYIIEGYRLQKGGEPLKIEYIRRMMLEKATGFKDVPKTLSEGVATVGYAKYQVFQLDIGGKSPTTFGVLIGREYIINYNKLPSGQFEFKYFTAKTGELKSIKLLQPKAKKIPFKLRSEVSTQEKMSRDIWNTKANKAIEEETAGLTRVIRRTAKEYGGMSIESSGLRKETVISKGVKTQIGTQSDVASLGLRVTKTPEVTTLDILYPDIKYVMKETHKPLVRSYETNFVTKFEKPPKLWRERILKESVDYSYYYKSESDILGTPKKIVKGMGETFSNVEIRGFLESMYVSKETQTQVGKYEKYPIESKIMTWQSSIKEINPPIEGRMIETAIKKIPIKNYMFLPSQVATPQSITKTETGQITTSTPLTKTETGQITIPTVLTKIDTGQITSPIVISKSNTSQTTVPTVVTKTETAQTTVQTILTKTDIDTNTTPDIFVPPEQPPGTPPTIKPLFFGGGMGRGLFAVSVRKRGMFREIGRFRSPTTAFLRGRRAVETSASASFKVTSLQEDNTNLSNIAGQTLPRIKFYSSKREPGVFIQKRSFRISTPGEKREITYKGIQKVRLMHRKKGIFDSFG